MYRSVDSRFSFSKEKCSLFIIVRLYKHNGGKAGKVKTLLNICIIYEYPTAANKFRRFRVCKKHSRNIHTKAL